MRKDHRGLPFPFQCVTMRQEVTPKESCHEITGCICEGWDLYHARLCGGVRRQSFDPGADGDLVPGPYDLCAGYFPDLPQDSGVLLGNLGVTVQRVCRELRLYISLLRLRFHSAGELFFRRRDAHGGHRHKHPDHQNQGAGENAGRERDGENAGQPAAGHLP